MRTFVPDCTCWSLLLTALAIRLRYKPTYDKLRVLIINKGIRKSLARKNGNESPIWSWKNSVVIRGIRLITGRSARYFKPLLSPLILFYHNVLGRANKLVFISN